MNKWINNNNFSFYDNVSTLKLSTFKNVVIFDDKLTEEDNNFKFEMLLENNYKIKLKIRDNVFEITGYFIYDSLNILPSRYNFVNEDTELLY